MDSIMEVPVELVVDDLKQDDEIEVDAAESTMAYSIEAEILEGKREDRNIQLNNF